MPQRCKEFLPSAEERGERLMAYEAILQAFSMPIPGVE